MKYAYKGKPLTEAMPESRFATLEDAQKRQNPIPSHIQQGNRIVPNPAWHAAPYAIQYLIPAS